MKLILLLLLSSTALSQHVPDTVALPNHSLYFELGGSAGLGSINIEELLLQQEWYQFSFSAGLTAFPIDKNNGVVFVVPTIMHCLIGSTEHKIECGLGQGFSVTTKGAYFSMLTPLVGYRYQNPRKSWFYRLSYTPLISYLVEFQYQNWFGLSIGYQW